MAGRKETARPLTPKQQRFAEEYLIDLNATQAAIRAGYSENGAGQSAFNLLKKPEIQALIEKLRAKTSVKLEVTRERVINELAKIAFSDIRSVVKWGRVKIQAYDGIPEAVYDIDLIPSDEISEDAAAAVAEVRKTRDGLSVKMLDKKGALDSLGKHLGLWTPSDEDEPPKRIEISWGPPREAKTEPSGDS